jgi:hypothetical protein
VAGGPDVTTVKLEKDSLPICEDMLKSNYVETVICMLLHMNAIKIDGEHKVVIIQAKK